jgi:hypothetical protein
MRNSSEQIVFFDKVIRQIVETNIDRAVELLLREFKYCNDRESFVAALIAQLVMNQVRNQNRHVPTKEGN